MSTSEFKSIVERYLKGEASAVDQAMIEAWLAATEDNPVDLTEAELQTIRADMLQHLREHNGYVLESGGADVGLPDREDLRNQGDLPLPGQEGFRNHGNSPSPQQEHLRNQGDLPLPEEHRPVTRVRRLIPWLQRIAVAVIFCIGTLSLFYYWRTTTVKPAPVAANEPLPVTQYRVKVVATHAIRKVVLPDSSVVMLNRSGSLHYNMPFDNNTREVFLDEGEAFFEVKKNTRYPFVVYANKTATTVLGTSFNIRINHSVSTVKIVVKSGKVKVATSNGSPDSSRLLLPEQGIEINTSNNNVRTFSQSANITTSWWDGALVFHQNSMKEVVEALENRYQVHIRLATPALQQYRVSGDFTRSHTLTAVLDALCLVHRLSYEKKNNEYFIYASIKKPVMR
jgi:ferric-dicitrate binding protein FerR (iron transport regulator)